MGEDEKGRSSESDRREDAGSDFYHLQCQTIISMIVTAIYNTADTYFVSKLGTSASGAVGIVMSLMGLIQSLRLRESEWAPEAGCSRLLGEKKDARRLQGGSEADFIFSLHGTWLAGCRDGGCCFHGSAGRSARRDGTIRPYARVVFAPVYPVCRLRF
ncbi:MAG: hypothetical protein ACLTSZ_13230 [Lachnospiraceae bacterium]